MALADPVRATRPGHGQFPRLLPLSAIHWLPGTAGELFRVLGNCAGPRETIRYAGNQLQAVEARNAKGDLRGLPQARCELLQTGVAHGDDYTAPATILR